MDNKITFNYECMFIVDTSVEETTKATVNKFVSLIAENGETLVVDEWGKRRLEYPINDKNEGYYVVVTFKSLPEFPAELERLFNIDENVMRTMILKIEDAAVEKALAKANAKNEAATAATEEAAPAEEAAPESAE